MSIVSGVRGIFFVLQMTLLYAMRGRRAPKPDLLTLGSSQQAPKFVMNGTTSWSQDEADDVGVRQVTWLVQEKVGYVLEGNLVPVGEHGTIEKLFSTNADVRFPSGLWNFPYLHLYKVVATKYGFNGGERVEFIGTYPNFGGIKGFQLGIVQAFHETFADHIRWFDLRTQRSWYMPKDLLAAPTPYTPKRGNGAWVGLYSVNAGGFKITEKVGTSKTSEATQTSTWASSVTATLSISMMAGVGFLGSGTEVTVGAELSATLSQEHSSSQSYSWTMDTEETFELTLPPNSGYLWQWHIRIELANGEVYQSKTRNFAVTAGRFQKPRCLPGWETDGRACQVCYNEESTLQLIPTAPAPTPPAFLLQHGDTGKCVHPAGGTAQDNARLAFHHNCDGGAVKLHYEKQDAGDGRFHLKHVGTGKCVYPFEGRVTNEADLVFYEGCTSPLGEFKQVDAGDGRYYLQHAESGYYVHPLGGQVTQDAVKLVLFNSCCASYMQLQEISV